MKHPTSQISSTQHNIVASNRVFEETRQKFSNPETPRHLLKTKIKQTMANGEFSQVKDSSLKQNEKTKFYRVTGADCLTHKDMSMLSTVVVLSQCCEIPFVQY